MSNENREYRQKRIVGRRQGAIQITWDEVQIWIVECRYCRVWLPRGLWTVDHVNPRGPQRAVHNLVIACWQCNQYKGNKLPCPKCRNISWLTTRDRIHWAEITFCTCGELVSIIVRKRPIGAPSKATPRRRPGLARGLQVQGP
jgi:hypothetical protein